MHNNSYTADGVAMANLIATNIYNEISSLCELVADYYDADATNVDISMDSSNNEATSFINQITICGDGHGMSHSTLLNLMNLGSSNKSHNRSPKFKRLLLGSFGIAFASILRLGESLDIYTRCSENKEDEVYYTNISKNQLGIPTLAPIQTISDSNQYLVPYQTGTTLVVKQCSIPSFIFSGKISTPTLTSFEYLESKLALLPVDDNFSLTLQTIPVTRKMLPTTSYNLDIPLKNTQFIEVSHADNAYFYFPGFINILGNTLPFHIYYKPLSSGAPFSTYERGIRISIHNRLIDYNYLDEIKGSIPSPGAYSTRILGIIPGDFLFRYMNASRNGLVDSKIHLLIQKEIASTLTIFINKIKAHYKTPESTLPKTNPQTKFSSSNQNKTDNTDNSTKNDSTNNEDNSYKKDSESNSSDKDKRRYQYQQRLEFVRNRMNSPNTKLKELGVQFCYDPNNEQETLCLIAQLCQLNLLPYNLLECVSHAYPDAIVAYKNCDDELGFLEAEHSLGNFFKHKHSIYDVDTICCWKINATHFNNQLQLYLPNHPEILAIHLEESGTSPHTAKLICKLDTSDILEIEVLVLSRLLDTL